MAQYTFDTPEPVDLFTEIASGSVRVEATDTATTHVEISGRDADEVHVRHDGDQVSVIGPKQRGVFGRENRLDVVVTLPTHSQVGVRTGSADIEVAGTVGATRLKSGSGDVVADTTEGPLAIETGSGDIRVAEARGELKVKSGSGDIRVDEAAETLVASTGSGDVDLGRTLAPVVVKTGSGDLKVREANDDVSMTTGSGDLVVTRASRGRITGKGASGNISVGIPAGTPVWTDISTVTGDIRSNVAGTGQPAEGADHVEVRAKTVSGDIVLSQA